MSLSSSEEDSIRPESDKLEQAEEASDSSRESKEPVDCIRDSASGQVDFIKLALKFRLVHEKIQPVFTFRGQKYLLFFTFRVLFSWNPYLATLLLVNNLLIVWVTLVGFLVEQGNTTVSFLGFLSLFVVQMSMHSWFGF